MNAKSVDVVIIGTGVAGTLLALGLARNGKNILLLEREKTVKHNAAHFLKPRAIRVLEKYNLIDQLSESGAHQRQFIRYYHDGELIIDYDYRVYTKLGYYLIIPAATVTKTIIANLSPWSNVEVWFGAEVVSMEFERDIIKQIHLSDGRIVTGKVIVGADGSNSFVRRQLQIQVTKTVYDYSMYLNSYPLVHSVEECNRLYLSSRKRLCYFYPCGKELFTAAVMLPFSEGKTLLSGESKKLINCLKEFVSESQDALAAIDDVSTCQNFPLVQMQAYQYFQRNAVLVGSALLNINPMTGQGIGLALEDSDSLCEELLYFFNGTIALSQALENYSQKRMAIHSKFLKYGHQLMSAFHNKASYLKDFDFQLHGDEGIGSV